AGVQLRPTGPVDGGRGMTRTAGITPDGPAASAAPAAPAGRSPEDEVTLLELLDRVLDKGVVLSGDVTLSVADVDLVYVGLRVLLTSIETARQLHAGPGPEVPDSERA